MLQGLWSYCACLPGIDPGFKFLNKKDECWPPPSCPAPLALPVPAPLALALRLPAGLGAVCCLLSPWPSPVAPGAVPSLPLPLPLPLRAALAFRLPPLAMLLLLPALPALAFAVPALPRLRLPLASAVPCLPLPVRVPPRRLPWSLPLGPQPDLNETILSLPKARHSCLALGNAKPPTFDHAMRSLACFLGALGASTDSK